MEIELSNGGIALIDDADFDLVSAYSWRRRSSGTLTLHHSAVAFDGATKRPVLMHRLLMDCPQGREVDHINRNGLDNRRQNLRLCTRQENMRNRRGNASSGYKGVHRRGDGSWRALICIDARQVAIGTYTTAIQAAVAYDNEAKKVFGQFAALNFPANRDWILPLPVQTGRAKSMNRKEERIALLTGSADDDGGTKPPRSHRKG